MVTLGLGFALLAVALLALALQRLYSSLPARELKRLASRNDQLAKQLYRVAAYGASLRMLLWVVLGITLPVSFLLLIPALPMAGGFALLVVASVLLFVVLPSLRLTVRSAHVAAWFVAPLAWMLGRTHPFLDSVATFVGRRRDLSPHSRLYEKEDLHWLLDLQKDQVDNRIQPEELQLTQRALAFSDRQAADVAQPREQAHLVNADDAIGPVLLDRLHKSRQSSFLVYKDSEENIVGSLNMQDAIKAKQGGRVFDLVRGDLTFVHEDFSLRDVLAAFQKTGQQVAVVINSFEEFVGLVTLEGILTELLGELATDELAYESRSAVAAFKPPTKQVAPAEDVATAEAPNAGSQTSDSNASLGTHSDSSPEATEVVE